MIIKHTSRKNPARQSGRVGEKINRYNRPGTEMEHTHTHQSGEGDSSVAAALAEQIMQGDRLASETFVGRYYNWLLFIVRRKFARADFHMDVVQEAFMVVLHKLQRQRIDRPAAILAYLRTTAINIGYASLRKDHKFDSSVDQELIDLIEDATGDDAFDRIEWQHRVQLARDMIQALPTERDRQILTKFYLQDMDKAQICTQLDLTPAHFDRVIYRAKERLGTLIAAHNAASARQKKMPGAGALMWLLAVFMCFNEVPM